MGLGHIIRSLALADMLREEFECHFIVREPLPTLKTQILEVCQSIIELPNTEDDVGEAQKIANEYLSGDEIVVLDGYHFVTDYQRVIKDKGCKLVCIDDIHAYHFVADVVINHAGGIAASDYSAEPYTQFCLGLKYALLRKPFREAAQARSYPDRNDKAVFICLGGADPNNDTLDILQKCESISAIEQCFLVIGSVYQHRTALESFLKITSLQVELLSNLSAEDMVTYMKKCGMAVTPPSTVSYEYLSVGGILYLKIIADNQKDIHSFFVKNNLAADFETTFLNPESPKTLSLENRFDGLQSKRFTRLFNALSLKTRKATLDDKLLYFEWTNDPLVRAQSYNSKPVFLENHINWFYKKIESAQSCMYIIELEKTPIGQIRFDLDDEHKVATISYTVDKAFRGRGLGEGILRSGIFALKKEKPAVAIIGYVKKNNIPSIKAFRAVNSLEEETDDYSNSFKYTI